jgi:hypothetical protein
MRAKLRQADEKNGGYIKKIRALKFLKIFKNRPVRPA